MTFEEDEAYRIQRVNMARWLGVSPREWDSLTYADQCDCIEIARAEKAMAEHDAWKARATQRTRRRA